MEDRCRSCDRIYTDSADVECSDSYESTKVRLDWESGTFHEWLRRLQDIVLAYADCPYPIRVTCTMEFTRESAQDTPSHSISCFMEIGGAESGPKYEIKRYAEPIENMLAGLNSLVKMGATEASCRLTWTLIDPVYRSQYMVREQLSPRRRSALSGRARRRVALSRR